MVEVPPAHCDAVKWPDIIVSDAAKRSMQIALVAGLRWRVTAPRRGSNSLRLVMRG